MGKKANLTVVLMAGAVLSGGCSSMNNTERGALGGGTIGALAGAAIDRHNPAQGAAIGAVAGGVLGGVAGNAEDAREAKVKQAQAYAQQPVQGPLSLEEISEMAKKGISDDVIRNQIRQGGTRYNLGPSQISWLHDNGVSDAVIKEMQNTMYYRRGPRTVYVDQPYDPVVVVPAPGPVVVRPSIGFGYGYYRYR
jgi:hypothetical protein